MITFCIFRYVSKIEWLDDDFVTYCSGSTYTMSPENIRKIFKTFESTLRKHYLWIEDVYLTGVLASMNNLEYENTYPITHFGKPSKEDIFMTCHVSGLSPDDWLQHWHSLFD